MVSFALGISQYGGFGTVPTSLIQPKQQTPTLTEAQKRAASNALRPGNIGTGFVGQNLFYQAPRPADPVKERQARIEKKRVAVEQAVGSRTPIFEDLPQPEAPPVATQDLTEDATPEQREEARLKEEARQRESEQQRQARRNQLRTFAGQRRSLLRPAARRPYYA